MTMNIQIEELKKVITNLILAMNHSIEIGSTDHLSENDDKGEFWHSAIDAGEKALKNLGEITPIANQDEADKLSRARDEFAKVALHSVVARRAEHFNGQEFAKLGQANWCARLAYSIADAMLKERDK